jgi:mono/diheme cytochrome c family protein
MVNFERKSPNEELDAADIVRGILKVQAQFAAAQNRPLGRGTHTKGICARATFEVFDLAHKIGDRNLTTRLAHGIYAKPGVYPATVRFANAASTIQSDRQPDLRAFSFSVELPPDLATTSPYQDYSLQSNTTFPINDAHTFAILMSVLSAGGGADKLKVIRSLSLPDLFRFFKAAAVGVFQEHGKTSAYQKMRYWSTVPFRNGPFEAVKYSAIPSPHNLSHALQDEPNSLQDELLRHLAEDEKMSSFDIALQLLDTERMTRWGMHREASFWVENATVEWKESQAPFHVVGRLTLIAKSAFDIAECTPRFIDVTQHSTPDSTPLGSVNRARLAAETASRKVRLGEETAETVIQSLPTRPPVPRSPLRGLAKIAAVLFVAIIALYFGAELVYDYLARRSTPPLAHVDQYYYLNQGWGLDRESQDRETYYYTPQGSGMHGIRYSWFVNLERPFHAKRITDPDHMRALNFIVDPAATPANPDQLPVGFARRYDETIHDNVVDITCAACHTGQINVTRGGVTTAIRIDGGESMAAFTDVKAGSFQVEIGAAVSETLINPVKFNRFANRVLGPDANTLSGKLQLWQNLADVNMNLIRTFAGSSWPFRYPTQEGYGRTDALTRIGNVVFGDHITQKNYRKGSAPVSYPYLWNIWKFNWVQYNASVSQPLARNVSESMGVGADFKFLDDYDRPIPANQRYRTSVAFENLLHIESTLQKLRPPAWPEDLLGPIDKASAARGQKLFEQHCVGCHGPHIASDPMRAFTSPGRLPTDPLWDIRPVDVQEVGTDATAADNFANYKVDLTRTGLTFDEVKPVLKKEMEIQKARADVQIPILQQQIAHQQEVANRTKATTDESALEDLQEQLAEIQEDPVTEQAIAQALDSIDMRAVNSGKALNILGLMIRDRFFADNRYTLQQQACMAGFDTLDIPEVVEMYKPRPLAGVWATPPFLHNGSVPNLYEMFAASEKERSPRFYVGNREFDTVKVGYVTEPAKGAKGGFWMDTSKAGNRNTGHLFNASYIPYDPKDPNKKRTPGVVGPLLTNDQKMDIIEYLKIHRDLPATEDRNPVDCLAAPK